MKGKSGHYLHVTSDLILRNRSGTGLSLNSGLYPDITDLTQLQLLNTRSKTGLVKKASRVVTPDHLDLLVGIREIKH